jgi:hypothetical protein
VSESERYLSELPSPAPLPLPDTNLLAGRGAAEAALLSLDRDLVTLEEQTALAPQPGLLGGRPAEAQQLRAQALRLRLDMLGYLKGSSDGALAQALRAFQQEAGLPVEGRANAQTWEALRELVTLESRLDLDRWYPPGGTPSPVLLRALQLRLQTLGLYPDDVRPGVHPDIALARFKAVAYRFQLLPPTTLHPERELISLLFDHERMIAALGDSALPSSHLPLLKVEDETPQRPPDAYGRFLLRLARNELWLAGYDVGDIREPVSAQKLQRALYDFWRDAEPGLTDYEVERRSLYISDMLYRLFLQQRRERQEAPAEDIAGFVERNKGWFQRFWEKAILQPISFLWDGLVRSAQWLGQHAQALTGTIEELFQHGVERAKALVWNVLRVLFRKASDVITATRRAAVAFMEGIQGYLGGELRASGPVLATCGLAIDCDATLVIGANTSTEALGALTQGMRRVSRAIDLARLVLIEVASIIARATQGPIGWILIISSLVRLGPVLVARVQALAES